MGCLCNLPSIQRLLTGIIIEVTDYIQISPINLICLGGLIQCLFRFTSFCSILLDVPRSYQCFTTGLLANRDPKRRPTTYFFTIIYNFLVVKAMLECIIKRHFTIAVS